MFKRSIGAISKIAISLTLAIYACVLCSAQVGHPSTQEAVPSTTVSSPVSLSVYLPASRLSRSQFGTPIVIEYDANDTLLNSRHVYVRVLKRSLYDTFLDSLSRPVVGDPREPQNGDSLILTYESVRALPGSLYGLQYTKPRIFADIQPGKIGYAKAYLILQELPPGSIKLEAHLILDRKEVASSPPVTVPVDEADPVKAK